ncbi:hypothetical protein E2542_SST06988 [Spatholobus suberectus]|nr:hypothetical protein E2542_SST06988 [Spatholobus suberectus]
MIKIKQQFVCAPACYKSISDAIAICSFDQNKSSLHVTSACLLVGKGGRYHIQNPIVSSNRNRSSITRFFPGVWGKRQNSEPQSGIFGMFSSSPQRNSRCKDFKVKQALQICVLLGVCIWMVYLVQHSREKKTAYSEDTKTGSELGRKDPHPYVGQSSIGDARHKEEEDEEENKHEEQNKTDNVNGVQDEILTQNNEQNNNEEKSEHRQDPVDQNTEESSVTNKESEENEHKDKNESDSVIKENEDNKNKVEDNQSREISEETEKEETTETEKNNEEDGEINQNRTEAKEHMEENHKQEDKEESNAAENEREENDVTQEVDSSEDRVQDKERNDKEPREKHYARDNASSVVGFNKTEQSDNREENNEFELESQTNGTEVAHLHKNENVLNVTQPKTTQVTDSVVTTTNQGNGSENRAEKKNDSQKSSIAESDKREQEHKKPSSDDVETLHSQNWTDTTSNTTEKQFETSENSEVEDSSLHNKTLKMKDSKSDAAVQADSTLTNSSGAHKRNVTNGEYNGKANANDNGHDGPVSASDSSILEEKDASSKNTEDADGAQNEPVESQKEKEESAH